MLRIRVRYSKWIFALLAFSTVWHTCVSCLMLFAEPKIGFARRQSCTRTSDLVRSGMCMILVRSEMDCTATHCVATAGSWCMLGTSPAGDQPNFEECTLQRQCTAC